ncbi:MAG: non-heme iron oxygenase ferredoxin subunit [Chloroflexi bacterium]|nr:non-heme iron oxygenase ferredoxin subunit [Chloroflexota bacterium]
MAFVKVATTDQFDDGDRIVAEVGDTWVAVFKVDGKYYAVEDICTHDDGPLAEGELHTDAPDPTIECPRHGAIFNLRTGKPTFPAVVPVDRYEVKIDGNDILIDPDNPINK